MTGTQIKTRVEKYIDDTIEDSDALEAINEALAILGDQGLIYATISFEATAGTWYNLPANCTLVVNVTKLNGNMYYPYSDYFLEGNNILFSDTGSYILHYRKIPTPLTTLSETPDVHESFQQCIVTYLKSWFKLRDDDESSDGLRLAQQFERDIQRVFNTLVRNRKPNQAMVIRHG